MLVAHCLSKLLSDYVVDEEVKEGAGAVEVEG